jgi:hypothetical protein
MRKSSLSLGLSLALLVGMALVFSLPGCATRTVQEKVVDEYGLTVKLRSQAKLFGETSPRGFDQPTVIPAARLELILRGLEIDERESKDSGTRERRPAVPTKIVKRVARGLSAALAQASPDQEVVVLAIRKQSQHGIFNRKFLTSFVSYLKKDNIYFFFSRVDWPLNPKRAGDRLPEPQPGEEVMPISTVGNATYQKVGSQGARVDWRDPQFAPPAAPAARSVPGAPTSP